MSQGTATERILTVRELLVDTGQKPERIDRWLTHSLAGATRNKVQEAITTGAVTVNGTQTKANYKVKPGDLVRLELMKPPPIELIPQDIPLEVLYEDADVLVVNKPAGMVTHPGFGNRDGTLVNAVLFHVGEGCRGWNRRCRKRWNRYCRTVKRKRTTATKA